MKCTITNNPQAEEVLIVSESNDVFAYNIDTQISRPFGVIKTNFYIFGCERVDNDFFVFGKKDMNSSADSDEDKIFGIDKFSLESRKTKFCYTRSYPTNFYSCSAKVNNEIMVFGQNREDNYDASSGMTMYDLREGLWTTLPTSIIGLDYCAVCQYNNTGIMKAGGQIEVFDERFGVNINETNSGCEIFDTRANSWRRTSDLPIPIQNAKCCQIKETVVLFGGQNDEEILQDIHTYNIAEETWTRNDSELCNIEDLHSVHLI
uniref:Kelch repeat protein n=1 Tax=Rhabditophanes sp. KR3021 TaxID=114890 RepID=A0AC35TS73_9BILA